MNQDLNLANFENAFYQVSDHLATPCKLSGKKSCSPSRQPIKKHFSAHDD